MTSHWSTVPYVTLPSDKVDKFLLRDGDIVVARTGASTGTNAYIADPPHAVFASYLVRLRAGPGMEPRFIYYCMQSDMYASFINGAIVPIDGGGMATRR